MTEPADIERIREFADAMPGGLKELVEEFIAHTTETVRELRASANAVDAKQVQMFAHRAAGTAGVCGAYRLLDLLRVVELQAKQKATDRFDEGVAEVEAELVRVHAFLAQLLQDERSSS
jgi:HPt (histidine-containing phosphotransfer) domain-containing protein